MSPPPAFSQALGERPPPAVRASLAAGAARHVSREARAARGATGEARGQAVPAQRHPPSRHAARPPARASPPPDRPRRPRRPRRRGGPPGPPGPPRPRLPGDAGPAVGGLTPAPWRHCAAPGRGAAPTPWRPQGIARPPSPPVGTASPWPPLGGTAGGEVPRAPWGAQGDGRSRPPGDGGGVDGSGALLPTYAPAGAGRGGWRAQEGGTLRQGAQAPRAASAAPGEAARPSVPAPAVAPLDEPRGRPGGQRAWCGGAGPRWGRVGGETVAGSLGTDRARASPGSPGRWRQRGGAPLRRAGDARRARGGRAAARGAALLGQAHQRGPRWQRGRAGPRQRAPCRSYRSPWRRAGARLWAAGRRCGGLKPAGTCRDLLKRREALGTCGQGAGVAPTQQAAERASRPGGRWRPGRVGTQRAAGSRGVDSLRTVVSPLQPQHRQGCAYRTAACEAALRGAAAPARLPTHAQTAQAAACFLFPLP